ncbi:MAG: CpaF family protein [Acidimicrobiia bacterium]
MTQTQHPQGQPPAAPQSPPAQPPPAAQQPPAQQPPPNRPAPNRWADRGPGSSQREQALEEMRQKMHQFVIHELGPLLYDQRVSEADLRRQVDEQLHRALSQERLALTGAERQQLVQSVTDDVLGYGPIDQLLRDPDITEVMVNGPTHVYVERAGRIEQSSVRFVDEVHVRRIIDKIVSQVGRRVDEANPMVDARLPDGSRVNVIVHPLAIGGPFMTIRKFAKDPYMVDDLINFGTLTPQVAHFINLCVRGRLNAVVSGGTGTGKTTLLNVLSSFIPAEERIVTVEDAKELQLHQEHVLPLEARPPNIEGAGEVRIRELVRNALRMRPDRIVVGEVRGGEALDMLQAMNTGHDGSITTVHSNSPRDTLSRIETMTLMAGMDLPVRVVREQMASALDLVVHLARLRDGTRRITQVSEVMGMEGDVVVLQDIYTFDFSMGIDEDGKFRGHLKSTGIRPSFSERLADYGISLDPSLFSNQSAGQSGGQSGGQSVGQSVGRPGGGR